MADAVTKVAWFSNRPSSDRVVTAYYPVSVGVHIDNVQPASLVINSEEVSSTFHSSVPANTSADVYTYSVDLNS